jgi:crotonobetainyl-CoA:carnitine CoA-transferase CaiB-like acyl-CoA transferase
VQAPRLLPRRHTSSTGGRRLPRCPLPAERIARATTLSDRLEHTDALDLDIAKLTRSHDAEQLAQRLRTAGVPAAKSATALDVISDQLLWDRELYRFVSDHREGQRPVLAAPWRMSVVQAEIARGAPDLGEHNDYVRDEILRAHATEAT